MIQLCQPNYQYLTTRDQFYAYRTYRQIQTALKQGRTVNKLLEQYQVHLKKSAVRVSEKRKKLPKPSRENTLPVTHRWDEIAEVIRHHQISIICGHTGSGKTTQIPQICLDIGLGARGKIAHTQPRRIAARTVASRIASELNTALGCEVGYKVRFDEKHGKDTTVLLQTDGMLLAEIQRDRFLNNYEVIIIDEAHERSLNIDFLLGYLQKLLPKRPDLKIIITSATIDPESFSKHFNHAPIVLVKGKTFPIKTLYRPWTEGENDAEDLTESICRAVEELDSFHYGDTLIFLPTERDIRETMEALQKRHLPQTEVLSLFARQTIAVQNAIFNPKNKRRIILSTNVAETSLTVPRIINVIDTGIARISRYSYKSKIQRLPIEPISQASADQRKGRCGRIAKGVCIRLYSEADFLSRSEFTDPEIKRTSLASVILQMSAMGLGSINHFPFVESPDKKMISDGYKLLFELQAVGHDQQLTGLGCEMARLPVDPRFAAVLLYAKQHAVLSRLLPIIAALVVGDIKERPFGEEQKADAAHRLFAHKQSDFLFFCEVFETIYPLFKQRKSQVKKWAKKYYLSGIRVREWLFLVEQLAEQLEVKVALPNDQIANQLEQSKDKYSDDYQGIHEAILVGFLDHIGTYQSEGDYLGVRNKRFYLFPGSSLFKKRINQVVCAEMVESSRVYARQVAKIDLQWLAPLCSHLTKTIELEPYWSKKQGNVMAKQTVLLYGLPIVIGRLVALARTQPKVAHDIFVRHGLVENAINTTLPEIAYNRSEYDKLLTLEEKSRKRDILIDDNAFAELYFSVIPDRVYSQATLQAWYAKVDDETKAKLRFQTADFQLSDNHAVNSSDYPDFLLCQHQRLPLTYEFSPSSERDGITVTLPLGSLNIFSSVDFDFLVPVLLPEKITALLKSLPKRYRRQFVPIPPIVAIILDNIEQDNSLIDEIMVVLEKQTTIKLTADLFDLSKLDRHYFMNIAVVDKSGNIIAENRDLTVLQEKLHGSASDDFSRTTGHVFSKVFNATFPKQITKTYRIEGEEIIAYPALTETKGQGSGKFKITLFDSSEKAHRAHEQGVLILIKQALNKEVAYIKKHVLNDANIALAYQALASKADDKELLDDMVDAVLSQSYLQALPRDDKAYAKIMTQAKKTVVAESQMLKKTILIILNVHRQVKALMKPSKSYYGDINSQLQRLVYAGFISATPIGYLPDIARYLRGVVVRLEKASYDPLKDQYRQSQIQPFNQKLVEIIGNKYLDKTLSPEVLEYAYLLEEYRLSVFSQGQVPVKGKVSEKRLSQHLIMLTS
ncbi:MAG: ATP-dependent RNA helicase HrpA [Ostreibacterium sp.]